MLSKILSRVPMDDEFYEHHLECGHVLFIRNAPPAGLLERCMATGRNGQLLEGSFIHPDAEEAECPLCIK